MNGILIIGQEYTGKGRLAKVLLDTSGKNVCHISAFRISKEGIQRNLWQIPKDTDIVYIPEFPLEYLDYLDEITREEMFITHNQGKRPNAVSPQWVVEITCSYEELRANKWFLERFAIMECIGSNEHDISIKTHHPKEIDDAFTASEKEVLS